MDRASGVLLPVFSLPSKFGIGTMGKEAYEFIDFLKKANQKYWQILPLSPTSAENSPYSGYSTFAGNPYLIDLEELVQKDMLDMKDVENINWNSGDICYENIQKYKCLLLKKAYDKSIVEYRDKIEAFKHENENWIYDYALFMALKENFDMKPWFLWPEDIRNHKNIDKYNELFAIDIEFHIFIQYIFFEQWYNLKKYANENGISIIGDIPIYVAMDSADVWCNTKDFLLDEENVPAFVAGVPPDSFSDIGQLWGNPLYNWDAMKKDGYGWWIRRIGNANKMFDVIRIDHFRAFESYWAVDSKADTASLGSWIKGPGMNLLGRINGWFPDIKIIAEDLGIITDEVKKLREDAGYPGMKILMFAFDETRNSDYLPHKYDRNCVCYCGTHDNATIKEWYMNGEQSEIDFANEYLSINDKENFVWEFIKGGMASTADLFIVQMQDYLELGEDGRMNIPGKADGNWKWRLEKHQISDKLSEKINYITKLYGR